MSLINQKLLFFLFISLLNQLIAQTTIPSNSLSIPFNKLDNDFALFNHRNSDKIFSNKQNKFKIIYNLGHGLLKGHSNIDNNGELYLSSPLTSFNSFRAEIKNKLFYLQIEPYKIDRGGDINKNSYNWEKSDFTFDPAYKSFEFLNNHNTSTKSDKGLKQSQFIIHYNGVGFSYGKINNWWSPGFHSSIVLSSNASSQETYSIGTFKYMRIGNYGFDGQVIGIPYKNHNNEQLYFTGLKLNIKFYSKPEITAGIHRTYLSGNFNYLSSETNFSDEWSLNDALGLVFEPLFGSSKQGLDYTNIGTPGFDYWDEILSGYIKIFFPEENLDFYINIASDDNRMNFTDLKAHWDHTLGYIIGIKKLHSLTPFNLFFGLEYFTTRPSNTFNPKFYRGNPNVINYYSKTRYQFFTYEGRFMGGHSGPSSDDLIFIFGISKDNFRTYLTYNKERHGIKSMNNPEIKSEFSLIQKYELSQKHTFTIALEHERIENYSFISNKTSTSNALLFNYSLLINFIN